MKERKVALCDMDGVLVDYQPSLIWDMKKLMAPGEKFINIFGETKKRHPEYLEERKQLIISKPEWWIKLPPIRAGIDLLNECKDIGFEIAILTKGPIRSSVAWSAKVEWIRKNLGYIPTMIVTTDKSLVYGRVLIDDYKSYVMGWLEYRPRGLVLMPKNKITSKIKHKNILTYDDDFLNPIRDQHEITNALINAYNRKEKK